MACGGFAGFILLLHTSLNHASLHLKIKQVVKVRAESMAAAAQQGKPHGMLSGAQRDMMSKDGWALSNGVLPPATLRRSSS